MVFRALASRALRSGAAGFGPVGVGLEGVLGVQHEALGLGISWLHALHPKP